MAGVKERAEVLREAAEPGSRIGLTELARSSAWRSTLKKRGLLEIVDRTDTAAYLVSVDAMNEMLDSINALESEIERVTTQQLFIARGEREHWQAGDELEREAQDNLRRRADAIREFLGGER
ncbi:hypothetical protein [Bifidobacterium simiarum]|uniref:Uncharacterized protein n=1 Tax=Bifidobacterium simiarum TaxID=2045441 RepID=A0A2M9HDI7_9BIFI|nr:hypothetical protein [Bifidobacterium simiarum]PJM74861.1 hypothetical protein CSQ87_07920 [Bifidobacterium simiarum]